MVIGYWLVSLLALTKYRCEFDNLNCIFATEHITGTIAELFNKYC